MRSAQLASLSDVGHADITRWVHIKGLADCVTLQVMGECTSRLYGPALLASQSPLVFYYGSKVDPVKVK